MKKLIILLALISIITPAEAYTRPLVTPPLPKQDEVAIVVLQKPMTDLQIRQLLQPYPKIKLRQIFHEAINGFSVEGDTEQLAQAQSQQLIQAVSPVNQYSAQTEESVEIIGAAAARRFLDKKNARLTGKGVTVGVIDTGVDYNHPDLRRNYGGGKDLVDNDKDPMETLAKQGQPTLHGTHVAGIIAANGRIQGVAPEAKIIAYRALGPGGGGTTEQVLAAIEQAIKDKVDIINLSLGNDINGPDLPLSLALNRAAEKGIVPVAANGNSGPNVWTVGSPGTAEKAISVGASTPTLEIPNLLMDGKTYKLNPMEGSGKWNLDRTYTIVDGGLGTKAELKNAQGKIVLIQRGRLTFTEKAKNAAAAGARAVIIYNNMSGNFLGNLDAGLTIPVSSLAKSDGEFLKKKLPLPARLEIHEEKDLLAEFSSRGPVTGTWNIKPDLVAPGVAINSTVPGGYLSLKGTSMAAPHVAGACALIKQAHPDWTPEEIKAALMNTARPLEKSYHTYEQGAGRIQVDEAVRAPSLVMPSSLKFGKFSAGQETREAAVTVKNTSTEPVRYSFEIPEMTDGLRWRFPLPFTLKPGESRNVQLHLEVDASLFKKKLQDGYLKLNAGKKKISIPYIYVLEEPSYPRLMGFHIGDGDKPGQYQYEMYLPGGADEFGIALFNLEDYRFEGFFDTGRNLKKGMIHKVVSLENLPEELTAGTYRAKVFVKKAGREDSIETMITIRE